MSQAVSLSVPTTALSLIAVQIAVNIGFHFMCVAWVLDNKIRGHVVYDIRRHYNSIKSSTRSQNYCRPKGGISPLKIICKESLLSELIGISPLSKDEGEEHVQKTTGLLLIQQ